MTTWLEEDLPPREYTSGENFDDVATFDTEQRRRDRGSDNGCFGTNLYD